MMRRSVENRRRSSTLAPKRVSESAVKSAVKPSQAAPGRVAAASAGSSSAAKSRLPRPSMASQRAAAVSGGPRPQRSTAGVPSRSRLTVGPRLSAVTPQTARRITGAATASKAVGPSRLSVDSQRRLSRGSGIGSSRQRCPDPRPVSDKTYWQPATHRVAQFLAERGYHEGRPPVTYKDLIKCTGRDFDDIFTFIYGMFSPNFTMAQKKREEEVPALMKILNYPGLITKSHLITIGCAHSWPSIVAMLDWLADEVNLVFGPADGGPDLLELMLPTVDNNGFPELDREACVLLEHSLDTYSRWLSGQDQGADVESQALADSLATLHPIDPTELRRLETENERLRQEAPDLSRLEQQAADLAQRRTTVDTDARRLAEYVAQRRDQQAERLKQQDWLQRETQQRATLVQMLRDQLDTLRTELSQQEMSAEDVAKIDQQRSQLYTRIDGVREEIEQMSAENGSLEMELSRGQAQRETAVRQTNTALSALQPRLPAAEGLQLRLRGAETDQLQQLTETERSVEGAERASRHQLEVLHTTLLQQERNAREVRGQLEHERQEQFHVTSRLRRLEEEDAADSRQLQLRHAALDNTIAEVEAELARGAQELQQLDVAGQRARFDAEVRQLTEENTEREQQLARRNQQVAESAALALEFRRWMEDDTDQMTRQIIAMAAEAGQKQRLTMQRHQQARDQPQQQQQQQREPLADRNQQQRDNRGPAPPPPAEAGEKAPAAGQQTAAGSDENQLQ